MRPCARPCARRSAACEPYPCTQPCRSTRHRPRRRSQEYLKAPLPLVLFLLDMEAQRFSADNKRCAACTTLKEKTAELLEDAALKSAIIFAGDIAKTALGELCCALLH